MLSATGSRIRGEIIIGALTSLGYLFVDATTSLPIGEPLMRTSRIAFALSLAAITLLAWIIKRRGHSGYVAVACALAVAFLPFTWSRITTAPDAAFATLLVVAALAIALGFRALQRRALFASALLVLGAFALNGIASMTALLSVAGVILVATVLERLPVRGAAKAVLLASLVVVLAADRFTAAPAETWRLAAWRDAVERTLPAGSVITTNDRELAVLDGRLFRNRPAGIQIDYDPAHGTASPFHLDRGPAFLSNATNGQRVVPTLGGPDEFLAHVPDRTIVGFASSSRVTTARPAAIEATLERIGRTKPASGAFVTFGIVGDDTAVADFADRKALFIGDLIAGTDQRAPTDVEMSATQNAVHISFRGRELISGTAWALIVISPRGPLLAAFSGPDTQMAVPVQADGLALWRRPH